MHMQKIVQNDADKQVMQRQNVLLFCGLLFPRIQHDVEMLTCRWNRFGRVICTFAWHLNVTDH